LACPPLRRDSLGSLFIHSEVPLRIPVALAITLLSTATLAAQERPAPDSTCTAYAPALAAAADSQFRQLALATGDVMRLTRPQIMLRLHGVVRAGPLSPGTWAAVAQLTQLISWPDSGIALGREALEAWPRCDSRPIVAALARSTRQSAAAVRERLGVAPPHDST